MKPQAGAPCLQQAASSASKGVPRAEGFELDLTGSQGAWVAAYTMLLGLASGQLIIVNLQADGGTVKRIKVSHDPPGVCICLQNGHPWRLQVKGCLTSLGM